MRILFVIGTNRRKGLLYRLCEAMSEGAKANGHEIELVNLYDYQIGPCRGCWACVEKGTCILQDDFNTVFDKVRSADVIVLAAPCYWGNVPGVMKNFFDRHTGYAMRKPKDVSRYAQMGLWEKVHTLMLLMRSFGSKPEMCGKKFIIITAMTVPFPVSHLSGDRSGVVRAMRTYVNNLKGRLVGKMIFSDSLFRFLRNKEKRFLQRAQRIGARL